MPKYTVKSPLRHDGKDCAVDSPVEMDEKTAAPLIAVGAIEPESEKAPPAGPTDPAERLSAIKDAISRLDKDNKKLWTKSGLPDLAALEYVLEWRPAAPERDQAWQELNPGPAE